MDKQKKVEIEEVVEEPKEERKIKLSIRNLKFIWRLPLNTWQNSSYGIYTYRNAGLRKILHVACLGRKTQLKNIGCRQSN